MGSHICPTKPQTRKNRIYKTSVPFSLSANFPSNSRSVSSISLFDHLYCTTANGETLQPRLVETSSLPRCISMTEYSRFHTSIEWPTKRLRIKWNANVCKQSRRDNWSSWRLKTCPWVAKSLWKHVRGQRTAFLDTFDEIKGFNMRSLAKDRESWNQIVRQTLSQWLHMHTQREKERQRKRQRDRDRERQRERGRQGGRQGGREAGRQGGREAGRQGGREAGR